MFFANVFYHLVFFEKWWFFQALLLLNCEVEGIHSWSVAYCTLKSSQPREQSAVKRKVERMTGQDRLATNLPHLRRCGVDEEIGLAHFADL